MRGNYGRLRDLAHRMHGNRDRSCALLSALVAVGVLAAGCGSSTQGAAIAVNACLRTGATRQQCECAADRAQAAGISPSRMAAEEDAGSALGDTRFVNAVAGCL